MNSGARDPWSGSPDELREKLRALTEEVARNELLLRKTQAREVELLRAHSLGELFDCTVSGLRDAYSLDVVTLSLFDPQHELRHLSGSENLSSAVIEEVRFIDAVSPLAARRARSETSSGAETSSASISPSTSASSRRWRDGAFTEAITWCTCRRHAIAKPTDAMTVSATHAALASARNPARTAVTLARARAKATIRGHLPLSSADCPPHAPSGAVSSQAAT